MVSDSSLIKKKKVELILSSLLWILYLKLVAIITLVMVEMLVLEVDLVSTEVVMEVVERG